MQEKMLRARIVGPRKAELVDAPMPAARDDWALVRVDVIPMCTEYKLFVAGDRCEYLGHEAAGTVVDVGRPCEVSPGDRVVVMPGYPCGVCSLCRSGEYIHCEHWIDPARFTGSSEGAATYAQFLVKPAWLLPRIPNGMSTEHASLACCALGPTFGAMDLLEVDAFDTVLITGLGPVGLGGVVNARYRGARVIGVEPHAWRAQRALDLGAEAVLDPSEAGCAQLVRDLTDGRGVDKAVDCAGTPASHRLCIEATRRKGHVAFVGECGDVTTLRVSPDLIRSGLTLRGSWHYNRHRVDALFQVIASRRDQMDLLVSHTLPFSQVQRALEISATHDSGKILLRAWE